MESSCPRRSPASVFQMRYAMSRPFETAAAALEALRELEPPAGEVPAPALAAAAVAALPADARATRWRRSSGQACARPGVVAAGHFPQSQASNPVPHMFAGLLISRAVSRLPAIIAEACSLTS